MKIIVYLIVIIVGFVCLGIAFVRLAPHDEARWNTPIVATGNVDKAGGAIRVLKATQDTFVRLDAAMKALPRTEVLAGSVNAGRVTYVTRSAVVGFPDYTTLEHSDGLLKMHARLRFGLSDLGVNRKRLEWLLVLAQEG